MDIRYTEILSEMYPDLYFVGLTRNGYATAEGHYRRGESISDFANKYQYVAEQMQNYKSRLKNFKLVRFEDILNDPFRISKELYTYLECEPVELNMLRLKSKKVIKKDGSHEENYGKSGKKYWFDKNNIKEIIKPDVNKNQIQKLYAEQISEFNEIAEGALKFFNYEIIS